jgi:hypothetical protein
MKVLLATIAALFLTVTIPVIGISMLIIIFFYTLATTDLPRYTSLAQYGLMSFSSRTEDNIPKPRVKDYNDYQIESFLSNKRYNKVSEIENVGLSAAEEDAFQDIANRLKKNNDI